MARTTLVGNIRDQPHPDVRNANVPGLYLIDPSHHLHAVQHSLSDLDRVRNHRRPQMADIHRLWWADGGMHGVLIWNQRYNTFSGTKPWPAVRATPSWTSVKKCAR